MVDLTCAEAARQAIAKEMRRDPGVRAPGEEFGEESGRGGVFGQCAGLADEFGPERICGASIPEASIMGASTRRRWPGREWYDGAFMEVVEGAIG